MTPAKEAKLREILVDCGCSNEWLDYYWNSLVYRIGQLQDPIPDAAYPRMMVPELPRPTGHQGFDPGSFAVGMIVGEMF